MKVISSSPYAPLIQKSGIL